LAFFLRRFNRECLFGHPSPEVFSLWSCAFALFPFGFFPATSVVFFFLDFFIDIGSYCGLPIGRAPEGFFRSHRYFSIESFVSQFSIRQLVLPLLCLRAFFFLLPFYFQSPPSSLEELRYTTVSFISFVLGLVPDQFPPLTCARYTASSLRFISDSTFPKRPLAASCSPLRNYPPRSPPRCSQKTSKPISETLISFLTLSLFFFPPFLVALPPAPQQDIFSIKSVGFPNRSSFQAPYPFETFPSS